MTVSKTVLRRLALQAGRHPENLEVLHDALLETFGEAYEAKIAWADHLAAQDRKPYKVVFFPDAMQRRWDPEYGGVFSVYEDSQAGFRSIRARGRGAAAPTGARSAVVVYRTARLKTWDRRFLDADTAAAIGDGRYRRYLPFHALSTDARSIVLRMYPYRGYLFDHYYYPVTRGGVLGHARRVLAIPHQLLQDAAYMRSLGYKDLP